jgi:hypothetical protein
MGQKKNSKQIANIITEWVEKTSKKHFFELEYQIADETLLPCLKKINQKISGFYSSSCRYSID